ncbi:MAG: DNA alkylation repair protein [Peptostreptococcus stomatis]|uniref:DNA alkylation repair protein n=1 Tax=Peptostreptococcus stomatis TaxID=341694 RepID=UPI001A5519D2|nr:DNA alkylation repair protein [Peptostreptococcus stomatis]MBL6465865.1 DNA alkylation repair protein [Peptostreptococcus stomatis]
MKIYKELEAIKEEEYAAFQARLIPSIDPSTIMGIRVPKLRALAKSYIKDQECQDFLVSLPHDYYDENMLHGILVSEIKDFDTCIDKLEAFLPYVDNWAVCDIMSPRVFKKHKEELLDRIKLWISSDQTYTCRFGLEMLMTHFLDDDFKPDYLELVAGLRSQEYYVNMMIAWFFATALAKQWEASLPYIEARSLDDWTHNKAIQKARESLRISKERKDYLKGLK